MKTITNLIIVDASGSMSNKKEEVKAGLKKMFVDIRKDMKKHKGKVVQKTIVTDFSGPGDIRVLVNSGDIFKDELADDYTTRGSTALYDAIAHGFNIIPKDEKSVFVSIITDGEENASQEYDYKKIKALITRKKKLGWGITFTGTTEEAIKKAVSIGISKGNTMTYTDSAEGYKGFFGKSGYSGYSGSAGHTGFARSIYYAASYAGTTVDSNSLLEQAQEAKLEDEEVKK